MNYLNLKIFLREKKSKIIFVFILNFLKKQLSNSDWVWVWVWDWERTKFFTLFLFPFQKNKNV